MRFRKELIFGLALLPAVNVSADEIYDSLTGPASVTAGYNLINNANFGPLADSFSTGSADFLLNDVQLALTASDPTSAGAITISLYTDAGTSPGSLIANLGSVNDSALSAYTPATVDFPLASSIDLSANTRYWIEASATDSSSAGWSYTTDVSGLGVASEYNANSFQVYANSGDPNVALINDPYQLQVNGVSTVPLPAAGWLFAPALSLLGLSARAKTTRT